MTSLAKTSETEAETDRDRETHRETETDRNRRAETKRERGVGWGEVGEEVYIHLTPLAGHGELPHVARAAASQGEDVSMVHLTSSRQGAALPVTDQLTSFFPG